MHPARAGDGNAEHGRGQKAGSSPRSSVRPPAMRLTWDRSYCPFALSPCKQPFTPPHDKHRSVDSRGLLSSPGSRLRPISVLSCQAGIQRRAPSAVTPSSGLPSTAAMRQSWLPSTAAMRQNWLPSTAAMRQSWLPSTAAMRQSWPGRARQPRWQAPARRRFAPLTCPRPRSPAHAPPHLPTAPLTCPRPRSPVHSPAHLSTAARTARATSPRLSLAASRGPTTAMSAWLPNW
jgi:hypothetical protein